MALTPTVPRVWRLVRAGQIEANPTTVAQRAGAFAAATPDGTVLLTRRDADGLGHYMIASNIGSVEQASLHLAQTVAARAEEIEGEPQSLLASRHIAVARFSPGSAVGRDTQAGAELQEISGRLASSLRQGEWVAVVMRKPRNSEVRRYQKWLQHQFGGSRPTHHSMQQTAVTMSLWAGADGRGDAKALLQQVAAAMPGFDVQIVGVPVEVWRNGLITVGAGILGFAAAVWARTQGFVGDEGLLAGVTGLALGGGLPVAAAGVLYMVGRIPSLAEKVRRLARYNLLLEPRLRLAPPSPPRRERVTREGETVEARDGGYPLHAQAFLSGPQLLAGIVAPHAGAASGTASTAVRPAPAAMRERIGPLLGVNDGRPVYLSAADSYAGVLALGQAGSGKSRLVQSFFAWAALDRREPQGLPGWPGGRHSLVAFESKGDGADAYEQWAASVGDPVLRIDFAGAGAVKLDILDVPGTVAEKARALVNALKYAFSDGSIQERSFDTLVQVFTAAFVAAELPQIAQAAELPAGASPFFYASALLGNRGDATGVALAGAIKSEAARTRAEPGSALALATEALAPMYEGKTPAQRGQLTDAPRNKVSALLAAENFWSRPNRVTWDMVLDRHGSVVINTGLSKDGQIVDDQLVEQASALFMYTLYEAIKRRCTGWYEQGRAVSIFADELKLLAGSNAQVITWLRDQGRSYGVRAVFATQYPEQLTPEVRSSVMGFGTMLAFSQNNPDVVRGLVADLSLAGDEWTGADVANLPAFETIVRATVGRARQTPFTVKIPDFWGRRTEFRQLQAGAGEVSPTG